jgi:chromosome segregation ATPase
MINELVQELRSYPAHYVAAHRAADALEKAEKNRSQMHYYACRLEDDLVKLEIAAESLREHIAEQQLDIVTLGQEVGRMREALLHCANSIAEWERKPEGVAPFLLGALDNARAALGEEKK